jgi:predicted nucleic acid-binding protein
MMIFDASTVILLAKINILELFMANYRGRVLIPQTVKLEITSGGREETPLITKLIESKRIEISKVKNNRQIKKLMDDFNIDTGEAEAIILAIQEGARIVATDDRNAIRACKLLKISFVTAIAILVRAFEKDLMDRDESLIKLRKLQSIGRYSKAIIEDARRQLKGGN